MDFLKQLGIDNENPGAYCGAWLPSGGAELVSVSPSTGLPIASVRQADASDYDRVSAAAHEAFLRWREVPGPQRGEYVRQIGLAMRELKEPLSQLVTLECGKILEEGRGEVQECIDIADFAVGLSRQLYGLTIAVRARTALDARDLASARHDRDHHRVQLPGRRLGLELDALAGLRRRQHLEAVGLKAPLTAIAMTRDRRRRDPRAGRASARSVSLAIIGQGRHGRRSAMLDDRRLPLISGDRLGADGQASVAEQRRQARLGKSLLELGGNNADHRARRRRPRPRGPRSIVFGAVGTAGQRCTSTRRVLVHSDVHRRRTARRRLLEVLRDGCRSATRCRREHADGTAHRRRRRRRDVLGRRCEQLRRSKAASCCAAARR